jgi:hypothetical protein
LSKLAFLDRLIRIAVVKNKSAIGQIAISPVGTAENDRGCQSWVNWTTRECYGNHPRPNRTISEFGAANPGLLSAVPPGLNLESVVLIHPLQSADPAGQVFFRALCRALEYPPDPEEEPAPAVVADSTCDLDWPEYRVHDNADRAVNGKIRWFWTKGQFVGLPCLV